MAHDEGGVAMTYDVEHRRAQRPVSRYGSIPKDGWLGGSPSMVAKSSHVTGKPQLGVPPSGG